MFGGNDRDKTFQQIITRYRRILFFKDIVLLGVLINCPGQGRTETRLMRATIRIMNRVGVTHQLGIVAVVVLQNDVQSNVGFSERAVLSKLVRTLSTKGYGLGMQDLFAFAELLYKFFDSILVKKGFPLGLGNAFIQKGNFKIGIQKRQFAQALHDALSLKFNSFLEDFGIRFKCDERAIALGLANIFELLSGFATLELHVIDLAGARHLDRKPLGNGINALGTDTVSAPRIGVSTLAIFSAGMQCSKHQLDARDFIFGMNINRNATPVVANRN